MITPGSPEDQSSFQSELAGIYGVLVTLEALHVGKPGWKCCIVCDGKSVLDRIQSGYPILPTEPHVDILLAVKRKVVQIGAQIEANQLPFCLKDAWLNIEAYLLAEDKVDLAYTGPTTYHLAGEGWICSIGIK